MGDAYVLCKECRLPEITMTVKKGVVGGKCKACGWSGDLDNNHRLASFITRHPPDETGHGIQNLMEAAFVSKKNKNDRRKEREEKRKLAAEEREDKSDVE